MFTAAFVFRYGVFVCICKPKTVNLTSAYSFVHEASFLSRLESEVLVGALELVSGCNMKAGV